MLARASSDAGTRLRRSKSASTVHRHPPPISELFDLDATQKQALAAATAAFTRAQGQVVADRKSKRSSDMSRSKSNASRKSLTSQGSHFPPRETSFRSLQPENTANSISTRRESKAATMNTEQFPPFFPTPSSDTPQSLSRPLSSHASITVGEKTRPRSQSKAHQQSASSSVTSQQIRKARSMYYASSVQTGSPIARPPAKYLTTPPPTSAIPSIDALPVLPLMRSLGPSPLAGPRIPVTVAANESVDSARDKYLESFQRKTVKHKPSMFLAPFKKRQDKGKDKDRRVTAAIVSVSTSSQKTLDEPKTDITWADFNPSTGPKEKRSFSGSLKSRFKRVFRRTSNRSPNLPVQQIEASRDYSNSSHLQSLGVDGNFDIPSPREEMIERVRSRTPSHEALRLAFVRPGSRTSSNGSSRSNRSKRSLHSESNATHFPASRATSWGTTSMAEDLTQRAIKRLTVIHEAKDSIGSEAERVASLVPKRRSLPLQALASFRDPMPMDSLSEESSTPIDPKRVFSALMKEINASHSPKPCLGRKDRTPGEESDVFASSATKELHSIAREIHSSASRDFRPSISSDHRPLSRRAGSAAAHSVQSKTSTIQSLGRAIRATIRTVTPAEQHSSPYSDQIPSLSDEIHAQKEHVHATVKVAVSSCEGLDGNIAASEASRSVTAGSDQTSSENLVRTYTPSASQIEKRVERAKSRWKTPLDEVGTPQFPREVDRAYNIANFVVQTESQFTASEPEVDNASSSKAKEKRDNNTPKPNAVLSPMSPSVYSRDTDGMSILPNDSVISFESPDPLERVNEGGSAVILNSQSVRSYVIGTPSPHRPESTRNSRDWKAWLSHEISSMESSSQEDLTIHERFMTPTRKHQYDITRTSHTEKDGDTTVIFRKSCDIGTIRPDVQVEPKDGASNVVVPVNFHEVSEETISSFKRSASALGKAASFSDASVEVALGPEFFEQDHTPSEQSSLRPGPSPLLDRPRVMSTPGYQSRPLQPLSETPRLSLMNDRFPFIETGRSSSSNSARSSRLSKSPPESVTSLKSDRSYKATPSPRVYSDLSAPGTNRASQRLPNVTLKRSDALHKRKENVTPPLLRTEMKHSVSPQNLASQQKSPEPLSSAVLNRNSASNGQYMSNIPEIKHTKHESSPATSPLRPRIHATLRPASTHDLSRRPRSAFDLRSPRKPVKTNMTTNATPMPRPTSELRRPAVQMERPDDLLHQAPTGVDERIICTASEHERSGSITPGQRMADNFLKQRKSTSAIGCGKMRGGMKLVREDTPAFL